MRVEVLRGYNRHRAGAVIEEDDATAKTAIRERLAKPTTKDLTDDSPAVQAAVDRAVATGEPQTVERPAAKKTTRKRAVKAPAKKKAE